MKFRFGRRRADADVSVRSEVGARNAPEYERIALSYKCDRHPIAVALLMFGLSSLCAPSRILLFPVAFTAPGGKSAQLPMNVLPLPVWLPRPASVPKTEFSLPVVLLRAAPPPMNVL